MRILVIRIVAVAQRMKKMTKLTRMKKVHLTKLIRILQITNYKLHRINDKVVVDAYIKTSILIPFGSRACRIHFDEFEFLSKRYLGNLMDYLFIINFN